MTKTLYLTVGLPRCGKSTWAKDTGFPMVNPDSIRLALHGTSFNPAAETMVWAIARYMVSALFRAGHDTVIVDATNTTKKRREFWKSDEWIRKYRIFHISKNECIRRCNDTEHMISAKEDLIPVIERMHEQWENVEDDEWDID